MRFEFNNPDNPYHELNDELGRLQTTLPLLSITGDQSLKYSLSITDIGDARADLLTEWGIKTRKKSTGT